MPIKFQLIKKILHYSFLTIFALFLIAFCVGIIFYASGYRVNFKNKKIQRTGLLVLSTNEGDIQIFIDRKIVKLKKNILPNFISAPYSVSLLPGEYALEVKKEGRISYEQGFKIEPELITKIEDIILPLQSEQHQIAIQENALAYAISPDNKKIIYNNIGGDILLYNIENGEEKTLIDKIFTNRKIVSYSWKEDSRKVIIKVAELKTIFNYLLDIENPKSSYFLQEKFSFVPFLEKIVFSDKKPQELFGLANNTLYSINTAAFSIKPLEGGLYDFTKSKDYLYYYKKDEEKLIQFDTNIYKETIMGENITPLADFTIIPLNNDKDIYLKNGEKIYFLEKGGNQKLIDENVDRIFIDKNQQNFYYTKEYELWFYNAGKSEKVLISRFSKKISSLQDFSNDKYLLYISENSVGIIKKDGTNNISLKGNIRLEEVRIVDKNTLILVEQKGAMRVFETLEI